MDADVADGVRTQCPGDLHVAGLAERGELVGSERTERGIRLPGLRDATDDDLASRHVGEDAPSERLHLRQEAGGCGPGREWRRAPARVP